MTTATITGEVLAEARAAVHRTGRVIVSDVAAKANVRAAQNRKKSQPKRAESDRKRQVGSVLTQSMQADGTHEFIGYKEVQECLELPGIDCRPKVIDIRVPQSRLETDYDLRAFKWNRMFHNMQSEFRKTGFGTDCDAAMQAHFQAFYWTGLNTVMRRMQPPPPPPNVRKPKNPKPGHGAPRVRAVA